MRENENRFVREVESAVRENPNVDMDLVREWQEITEILDNIPQGREPEPKVMKPRRLQPIPLRIFSR